MSSELVEIVGTDLAQKECFGSQLPEYRHDIHMVSSAQNRHNTFYSISLSGQLFMFFSGQLLTIPGSVHHIRGNINSEVVSLCFGFAARLYYVIT